MRGPGRPCADKHPEPAQTAERCPVCRLYETREDYRRHWDEQPPKPTPARSLPCTFLGDVIDRLGCDCPAKWLRACGIHGSCTIDVCKRCPDYVEGG